MSDLSTIQRYLKHLTLNKMKSLLRDFKKFYQKQVKIPTSSKIQEVDLFEEYVRTSGLAFSVEESDLNKSPNLLSISFYLSLIVNSSLCFTNNKFAQLLEDHNYLGEKGDTLLTVNDVVFKLTINRLCRFFKAKENMILLNYFLEKMNGEYKAGFVKEISLINAIENAQD